MNDKNPWTRRLAQADLLKAKNALKSPRILDETYIWTSLDFISEQQFLPDFWDKLGDYIDERQ